MNEIASIIAKEVDRILDSRFSHLLEEIQKLKVANNKPESNYISRKETARLIGITLPTLASYLKRGLLKGYRISGKVLFLKHEVEGSIKEIQSIKHRREEYLQ